MTKTRHENHYSQPIADSKSLCERSNAQPKVTMEDEDTPVCGRRLPHPLMQFRVGASGRSALARLTFGEAPHIPLEEKFKIQDKVCEHTIYLSYDLWGPACSLYERTIYLSYAVGGPSISYIEGEKRADKEISVFCGSE